LANSERGWLVPDDWNGIDFTFFIACVPDSPLWKGNFKGSVYLLSRQYSWDSESGDVQEASEIGMEIFDNMTSCSGLVSSINELKVALAANSCGCEIGSDVETSDGQEGGPLPDPIDGVAYEPASAIVDRKCLAANYVHQSVLGIVTELKDKRADQYGFAGLAFVLSVVATIVGTLLLGPFGLLIGAVSGSLLTMATLLFKASFSLLLLETAILADEDEAICTLFEATSAGQARTDYTDHLLANGATSLEVAFVDLLLTNNVVNLLFFAWGDSEDTISSVVPTSDCSTCGQILEQWLFPVNDENWTFIDISTPPSTASMLYNAGAEALRNSHTVAQVPTSTGAVRDTSPVISLVNNADIRITVNFGAPTDGLLTSIIVKAQFLASPEETNQVLFTAAGTLVYTFTTLDTITSIDVETGRSQGGSPTQVFNFDVDIFDVTLERL